MITRERMEQATAWALGALDPAEHAEFAEALADSGELRREVAEMERTAALLAHAVARRTPSTALRGRILRDAATVRPLTSARSVSSGAMPVVAPRTPSRVMTFAPWLALAASVAGLVVVRRQASTEEGRAAALGERVAALAAQLASRDSTIDALLSPDVASITLASSGQPPSARMYWNRGSRQVVFVAFGLGKAAAGRTYQLWAIAKGKAPVSLGTFDTDVRGQGRVMAQLPAGMEVAVGAVTEEPSGGSPQPTTTPFLVGEFK